MLATRRTVSFDFACALQPHSCVTSHDHRMPYTTAERLQHRSSRTTEECKTSGEISESAQYKLRPRAYLATQSKYTAAGHTAIEAISVARNSGLL